MNFLCLQGPQRSDEEQLQPSKKQQRRSVKPMTFKRSHQDLQQITQSRFIKTTFNKSNITERKDKVESGMQRQQQPVMSALERHLNNRFQPSFPTIYPNLNKNVSFSYSSSLNYPTTTINHFTAQPYVPLSHQPMTYQPKEMSFSQNRNNSMMVQSSPSNIMENKIMRELHGAMHGLTAENIHMNIERGSNVESSVTPTLLSSMSYKPESLLDPVANNIQLLPSLRPESILLPQRAQQVKPIISNKQIKDDQQDLPLKSKFNQRQRTTSLISQEQIKKGFKNSFTSAKSKVDRVFQRQQQQQVTKVIQLPKSVSKQLQQSHSISIVSNLISQSYSPLKKQRQTSSVKKRKRPIFGSSINNKTSSEARQSRPKAISQYNNNSVISFGTPESAKYKEEYLGVGEVLNEYELKTEKEEVNQTNNLATNAEDSMVPAHILSAWKKVREAA